MLTELHTDDNLGRQQRVLPIVCSLLLCAMLLVIIPLCNNVFSAFCLHNQSFSRGILIVLKYPVINFKIIVVLVSVTPCVTLRYSCV
jgi:hypothetical protein